MTVSVTAVEGEAPYCCVSMSGEIGEQEFGSLVREYRESVAPWTRVLIDASTVINASSILTMLVQARNHGECPEGVRQAAVVPESAAAVARTWVRLISPGSGGVQAFTSERSALTWLQEAIQSTSGGS